MRQAKNITGCTGTPKALSRLALRYGRGARLVDALRAENEGRKRP